MGRPLPFATCAGLGFSIICVCSAGPLNPVNAAAELNAIQQENTYLGTTEWRLTNPALHREIEGYASLTSVDRGGSIALYVNTQEPSYDLAVYRMGWYAGRGARLVHGPVTLDGISQPPPNVDHENGLIECEWHRPYILGLRDAAHQDAWTSGVYLTKLTGNRSGAQAYIIFVVRDDARHSDFLFQSSVTTYQAYNNWGGKSLYDFNSDGRRAYKVSFNRPYAISSNPIAAFGNGAGDFLTNNAVPTSDPSSPAGWEYNMVRWLEREGYDIAYSTNIDTHADPNLLSRHKAWLSVGHDEYWTWDMRRHVETARDRGTHLAFFSGNTCYWQIRLEPSVTGEANRIIVSYKDDAPTKDPYASQLPETQSRLTVRWRDYPVNNSEESLIGVMYDGNPVDGDIIITKPQHWVMAGTDLREGDRLAGLLGYEADRVFEHSPPGITILAESPYQFEGRRHVAHLTIYSLDNRATVFAAGTIQWSWGLDDFNVPALRPSRLNPKVQQITSNVLARFQRDSERNSQCHTDMKPDRIMQSHC
ncbi:MAG TPA: N,N-dimethylformamidase beta subunit family domain-containing protein [Nitrospira sp.]|nr:N,N-dimethylformamidase beta subunit family domain-containing protein [Nitrospira sp.]